MNAPGASGTVRFDRFVLDADRRSLTADGLPIPVSARGYDILALLIRRRDRVVGRDEIMEEVWRGAIVEDSNLAVQISTLRRLLGERQGGTQFILTVQGRGYRFIAPVQDDQAAQATAPVPAPAAAPSPGAVRFGVRRRRRIVAMLGGLAVLGAVPVLMVRLREVAPAAPPLSIVVLPFRQLGSAPGAPYVADSIDDDLTTDLSHIPGSLVIARSSAAFYETLPVDRIGRALHVRYALEGSVRSFAGMLRINAQLIEIGTGANLWAEHYDVEETRLWDGQGTVVRRIVAAVDNILLRTEVARASRDRPDNQDALDLFFRARSIVDRGETLDRVGEAQRLLERAIQAEPDFVDALSTLGWVLARKLQAYDYPGYAQDIDEAERVTAHALTLAPGDPAVLAARGRFLAYRGQCSAASVLFDAALAVEPNNLFALSGEANCAWLSGMPDRVVGLVQALQRIDPQGPAAARRLQLLGLATLFAGHPAQAIPPLQAAESGEDLVADATDRITPIETTRLFLIAANGLAGNLQEAKRRYETYSALWPNRTVWREMTFFTAAQERMPGFAPVADALQAAGMPRYADERAGVGAPPPAGGTLRGADFTPTPLVITGAARIETRALATRLAVRPAPLVVDVGRGRAAIPGAVTLSDAQAALDRSALVPILTRSAGSLAQGIVVMGTGASGVNSYNLCLHLIALGFPSISWYRGGEEAWAASGLPSEDRRQP